MVVFGGLRGCKGVDVVLLDVDRPRPLLSLARCRSDPRRRDLPPLPLSTMIVEPSKGVTARDFAHKASSGAPLHHHPSKHLTSPSAAHPHAVMRHDDHIQRLYIGPHLSEFLPASSGTDPASLRRLARSRHEVGKLWKHAIRHGHEGKKGKVEMKWKGGSFVIGEDMREAYWDSLAAEKDEVGRVGSSKDMLVAPKRTESPPPMLKEEREEVDDIGKGKGREEDRKITPDSPDVFLKQLSPPQSPGKSLDGRSPSGADLDVKHGNLHERLSRAASAAPSKPSSDTAVEADDHRPETSTAKVKRSKSARFAEPEEAIGDPRRPRGDDVPIPPEEVLGRDQDVQAPPQTVDSRSSAEEETFFRRDRMLVRQGWAARETLPTPFDAKFARALQVTWHRWQEFAVVYRRQRLEIWERPVRCYCLAYRVAVEIKHSALSALDSFEASSRFVTSSLFTTARPPSAYTTTPNPSSVSLSPPKRTKPRPIAGVRQLTT